MTENGPSVLKPDLLWPSVPAEGESLSPRAHRKGDYVIDPETGCWNWAKTLNRKGYGTGQFRGAGIKTQYAHRAYWMVANREMLEPGMTVVVDHLCRNPRCVNPAHLEAVRQAENTWRGLIAKLAPVDVDRVRERIIGGDTFTAIAKDYGLHIDAIYRIAEDSRWREDPNAPRQPIRAKRNCPTCGEPITEGRRNRRYCKPEHRPGMVKAADRLVNDEDRHG